MNYRKIAVRAACLLVVLGVVAATIWDFSRQLQRALTRETYRTLSAVSGDYNKAFLDRISYNIKTMDVLAGSLSELEAQSQADILRILQNAVRDGGFANMAVCDARGIGFTNDGVARDVSHRDYFQTAMQGQATISQPISSAASGETSLVIAVPVTKQGQPVGVLFGAYPLSAASAQLLDFTYYSEGYGFVVTRRGDIILSSEHDDRLADERNLFSFFEKTDFVDYSLAELRAALQKGEGGSFTFRYGGERRFVSFTPTTINDWYTFSLSSDASMLQQEMVTNEIVFHLVLKLVVVALALLVWILLSNRRHNQALLAANKKYQSLLDHINGGMIVAVHSKVASETIATYVSPGFTEMTGYTLEDIQTIYHGRYLDMVLDEDRDAVFGIYLTQIAMGNTYCMPYRLHKKDGSFLWVMDNGYLVEDADGLHNHSIVTDITAVKEQEEALRLSENRFSVAINASSGALFEVDLKRQLYTHFENAERIFGVQAERLLADTRAFSELPHDEYMDAITRYFFHPEDRPLSAQAVAEAVKNGTASFEARLRRFDNRYIWSRIDLSISLDAQGVPKRLVGFMSDIDDIKKQAELLENQVQTDPMTGLYNKIAMATLSNKILREHPNGRHALLVLDIDNFKGINDTLGHAFGDLVLIEVCGKLKSSFRNNDIVGRMGGDEFAVLMKNVADTSSVLKKATELSGIFRQTYAGEKADYRISCSIGLIMIEHDHDSFETLYRKADAALYQAKQGGKDQFVLYQEKDSSRYPIEITRTNDEELQNLKASHNMEAHIFELLYTSKDFNVSIHMALAAIGQQYHVSRVSIFENDADGLTTSNIYEWCREGISAEISHLQKLPLVSGTESILDSFDRNGLLYCSDVQELSPYIRKILESQGILSNLQVTIYNDEKICGFIGFDECTEYRVWTAEEVEKLSFLSKVLSVFLFKKKTEISLLENLHTRLEILEVLPDCICVVNPRTHCLEYTNTKMQELLPSATPGAFCFTNLHGGQNAPCATCLVERIRNGDTENLEILNADCSLRLKVNALSINWTKNQEMVLLYGSAASSVTP